MLLYALDLFPGDLYGWRCLREECPVYAGPYPTRTSARDRAERHQREHVQAPRAGICGNRPPQLIGDAVSVVCELPSGHAGWHQGGEHDTKWSVELVAP